MSEDERLAVKINKILNKTKQPQQQFKPKPIKVKPIMVKPRGRG